MSVSCYQGGEWCADTSPGKINYLVVVSESDKRVVRVLSFPDATSAIEKKPHVWEKWEQRVEELMRQYLFPEYDVIVARFRDLEHLRFHIDGYHGWEEADLEIITEEEN